MKIECEIPCGLSQRIVPGEGPVDAKVMLIGEAPGASEEIQLRPFVGKSGMLLRQVLESLKISPDSLYITNVLKCRPPKNRTPKPKEIECCSRILWKEISTIKPEKIICLGATAAKFILKKPKKIEKLRLESERKFDAKIYFTYHPAEILRNPELIDIFIKDLERFFYEKIEFPAEGLQIVNVSPQGVPEAIKQILMHKMFAFDIEATGLDIEKDKIYALSIVPANKAKIAYFFNLNVIDIKELEPIFTSKLKKICFNAKYDVTFLRKYINVSGPVYDLLPLVHLIEEGRDSYSLKSIAVDNNIESWDIDDALKSIPEVDEIKIRYCSLDAFYTLYLFKKYYLLAKKENKINLYKYISNRWATSLIPELEQTGIKIDYNKLKLFKQKLENKTKKILEKINELPKVQAYRNYLFEKEKSKYKKKIPEVPEFNINSHIQLKEFLTKYYSPVLAKYNINISHMDEETIENLKSKIPFLKLLSKYRKLFKILSTYVNPFLERLNGNNHDRIHGEYYIYGTVSGRISSSNPNMQNLPPAIHPYIVPREGHILMNLDFSQIEVRTYALLANDKKMIELIKNNIDVHTWAASTVWKKKYEEVSKEERKKAKTIVFGLMYGMGIKSLANRLNVSEKTATKFYDKFRSMFSYIASWKREIINEISTKNVARNPFGRTRKMNILKYDSSLLSEMARYAFNYMVQSTASDLALFVISRFRPKIKGYFCMAVHDGFLFEIPENLVNQTIQTLKDETKKIENMLKEIYKIELTVPFVIDCSVGYSFDKLKKIDEIIIGGG